MATKYEATDLREEAIARIQSCFPESLTAWDNVRKKQSYPMAFDIGEEIAIVNLLRLCRVDGPIPLVLYACCQLEISTVFDGVELANGTVEKLSPEDIKRCIVGRDRLFADNEKIIDSLWSDADTCDRHKGRADRISIVRAAQELLRNCDPLAPISHLFTNAPKCPECALHIKNSHRIERLTVWGGLAKKFDVG
jgi:hypothetical protein